MEKFLKIKLYKHFLIASLQLFYLKKANNDYDHTTNKQQHFKTGAGLEFHDGNYSY